MSDRAWEDLLSLLDEKYTLDSSDKLVEKLEDNPKLTKTIERVEFEKDNTKFRIERVTSPAIVDKKTHYTHRGSANRVEYTYDEEDTTTKVFFYKKLPSGNYNEIAPEELLA